MGSYNAQEGEWGFITLRELCCAPQSVPFPYDTYTLPRFLWRGSEARRWLWPMVFLTCPWVMLVGLLWHEWLLDKTEPQVRAYLDLTNRLVADLKSKYYCMLRLQPHLPRALPNLSILSLVTGRRVTRLSFWAWRPGESLLVNLNLSSVCKMWTNVLALPIPWGFPLLKN